MDPPERLSRALRAFFLKGPTLGHFARRKPISYPRTCDKIPRLPPARELQASAAVLARTKEIQGSRRSPCLLRAVRPVELRVLRALFPIRANQSRTDHAFGGAERREHSSPHVTRAGSSVPLFLLHVIGLAARFALGRLFGSDLA